MNELQIFNSPEFGEIRAVELDGEPWFVGKDIAEAVGYANPSKAIIDHVDDEDKRFEMLPVTDSQNGNLVKTALINESGVYSLIFSSKLESAKKFKHWVTSEVLPAIRKTGAYIAPQAQATPAGMDAGALQAFTVALDTLTAAVQTLTQRMDAQDQTKRPQLSAPPTKPLNNKFRRQWMQTASQKLNTLADECGLPSTTVLHNIYGEMEMELDISLPEVRLKAVEERQLSDCSYLLAIFYDDTLRKWFMERVEFHLTEVNPFW